MNNTDKELYEIILKTLIKELPINVKVNYKELAIKIKNQTNKYVNKNSSTNGEQ